MTVASGGVWAYFGLLITTKHLQVLLAGDKRALCYFDAFLLTLCCNKFALRPTNIIYFGKKVVAAKDGSLLEYVYSILIYHAVGFGPGIYKCLLLFFISFLPCYYYKYKLTSITYNFFGTQ
ncbi:hypothetical protein ACJX0J_040030 [Zea mays]